MAIDTAAKRRSSAASRRMPWMRRFGVAPTGSIAQAERQQGAWVYSGILAGAPPVSIIGELRVGRVRVVDTLSVQNVRSQPSRLRVGSVKTGTIEP